MAVSETNGEPLVRGSLGVSGPLALPGLALPRSPCLARLTITTITTITAITIAAITTTRRRPDDDHTDPNNHNDTGFQDTAFVGSQSPRKNLGSHIDASHSRQPLVKGERLVRYEVNAVMPPACIKPDAAFAWNCKLMSFTGMRCIPVIYMSRLTVPTFPPLTPYSGMPL